MSSVGVQSKYRDIKLFLWLIPFINIINYYLTYSHFGSARRVAITFTIDTIEGYIAWWIVRLIIIWLDKKVPYTDDPVRRIAIQLVLTLMAGSASIVLLTELVNKLASNRPVPSSFYTTDIFIISIWFFVVNGIYVGLFYFQEWQQSEQERKREMAVAATGFRVSTPKKDLIFSYEEIAGFYIDGDYCIVVTLEKKKFFVDSSLDGVEKTIPASSFFRLNRQYIAHRQLIVGYEKGENGKLNVLLKGTGHLPQSIPVSRTRAPVFKSWFLPS